MADTFCSHHMTGDGTVFCFKIKTDCWPCWYEAMFQFQLASSCIWRPRYPWRRTCWRYEGRSYHGGAEDPRWKEKQPIFICNLHSETIFTRSDWHWIIINLSFNFDFIHYSDQKTSQVSFSCKGRPDADNSSVSVLVTNMCLYSLLNIK